MKSFAFLFSYFLLFIDFSASAQERKVHHENQQWIQYYNQLKLSEKWALFTDGGFRWKDGLSSPSQYIVRTAGMYKINKEMSVGAGFAHLGFYTSGKISRVEFRPYQEFALSNSYASVGIQHRFRLEERFFYPVAEGKIQADRDFNFRFRYRFLMNIPLFALSSTDQNKKVSLSLGDEIFLNAGKEITTNFFDQNRLLLGSIINLDKNIAISLTYNNQFASTKTAGNYNQANVLWLGITQKIDASKPQ